MALTSKQIEFLRALAHNLDAVVQVGIKGMSHAVVRQIEQQLEVHELIKVKIPYTGAERKSAARTLADETGAELVQVIGKTVVLYRANADEPQIVLPGAD